MTEKYDEVMEVSVRIDFDGKTTNVFGYDKWLEQFERVLTILHTELVPDSGVVDPPPWQPPSHPGACDLIVSTKDYHQKDPKGKLGLGVADVVPTCVDPKLPQLFGHQAKDELERRLTEGFAFLLKAGADPKQLSATKEKLDKVLKSLPDPAALVKQGKRHEKTSVPA